MSVRLLSLKFLGGSVTYNSKWPTPNLPEILDTHSLIVNKRDY